MKLRRPKGIWQVGTACILVASFAMVVAVAPATAFADGCTERIPWTDLKASSDVSEGDNIALGTDAAKHTGDWSVHLDLVETVDVSDAYLKIYIGEKGIDMTLQELVDGGGFSWWTKAAGGVTGHMAYAVIALRDPMGCGTGEDAKLEFHPWDDDETIDITNWTQIVSANATVWDKAWTDNPAAVATESLDDLAVTYGDDHVAWVQILLNYEKMTQGTAGGPVSPVESWNDADVYLDDVRVGDICFPIELGFVPDIALDSKGSEEKFFLSCAYSGHGQDLASSQVEAIEVIGGVNLTAQDVEVVQISGIYDSEGGSGKDYAHIGILSAKPGDCHVRATVRSEDDSLHYVTAEKKWGVIDHTALDLDPASSGIQTFIRHRAGTQEEPDKENFVDTVYDWFYWGETGVIKVYPGGHQIVHWWLFDKDKMTPAELAALDALVGCDSYDPPPALNPFAQIDSLHTGNETTNTTFTLADGAGNTNGATTKYGPDGDLLTDDCWLPDPNVDSTFYNFSDGTYLKTMTMSDIAATDTTPRGTVEVEVTNVGVEDVIIITLSEYCMDFHGENPVCVEKGEKVYTELPSEIQVKIPQVRWAGEKMVLEKKWPVGGEDFKVTWQLDSESIGTLVPTPGTTADGPYMVVDSPLDENGLTSCIIESEYEGQAEVKCILWQDMSDSTPEWLAVDQHDFPVFFLKLESLELLEPDPDVLEPDEDTAFGVQVRGWFTTGSSNMSTRPVGEVDYDGDGVVDEYLPAGRWVLPDDWPVLAGLQAVRSHWDIMDNGEDDIISTSVTGDVLGPYDTGVVTTDPPGEAEAPTIGPFNTLQRVALDPDDDMVKWVTAAEVPADADLVAGVRNTTVPNGVIDWQDCPMPPALVYFECSDTTVDGIVKKTVPGYTTALGAPDWPFYAMEIPAHMYNPLGSMPEGYYWDSWGFPDWDADAADGPYPFFTDLEVFSTTDDQIEVYSDNNGRAFCLVSGMDGGEMATITTIVDYPFQRKHPAHQVEGELIWGEEPEEFAYWCFSTAGFFPKHLPDTYTGEVVLADLVSVPAEIQGVWYYDELLGEWSFWIPGVGGDLLVLLGGEEADYMVLVSGECECWDIPLLPVP
jgi:hypothetical protein